MNAIVHIPSDAFWWPFNPIGVKLTTPNGRRSQCLAVVHIIGTQIAEVDGANDAMGFMARPFKNVDLTLQRPSVLLTLRHHPQCRP